MFQKNLFRKNLLATSILVAAGSLYGGYGNKALAGSCTFGEPTATDMIVTCSGAASATGNDTPHFFEFTGNITITDDETFGFDNTGTATSDNAIETYRGSANINLQGDVESYDTAIRARVSEDDATIQITTSGLITSFDDKGISTNTDENSGDITIMSSSTIVSDDDGIYAEQEGIDANVTITNSGSITSTTDDGIKVFTDNGAGYVNITNSGSITSQIDDGIYVSTETDTGNVTITNQSGAQISVEEQGIFVGTEGEGALTTINNSGSITSDGEHGIHVEADEDTGNITITHNAEGSIRAELDGIIVESENNATTQIASSGTIISDTAAGIQFTSTDPSTPIVNIDVNNDITASNGSGIDLINTENSATTTSTINVDNGATIDAIKGIDIQVGENSQVAINIKSGTTVKGSVNAIEDTGVSGGKSAMTTVTLEGALEGDVSLGGGDDVFTMKGSGARLATDDSVNGGDDTDEFFFDNVQIDSGSFFSNAVNNFELIELKNASTIRLNNGSWTADMISVDSGNTLQTLGSTTLTGNVTNNGIISLRNGEANEILNITGNLSGSGTFELDADLEVEDDTDYINVGGNVTGSHTLAITNLYGLGYDTGTEDTDGIKVVDVTGTAASNSFSLQNGPINAGAFVYDLHKSAGNDFYLQSAENAGGNTLSAGAAVVNTVSQGSSIGANTMMPGYFMRQGRRIEAPIRPVNLGGTTNTLAVENTNEDGISFAADLTHASDIAPANKYWLRLLGAFGEYEGRIQAGGSTNNTNTKVSAGGVQMGVDFALPAYHSTHASLWGHYLYQNNDVTNITQGQNAGGSTINSYGLGLGITYDPGRGMYFDTLGSISFSSADIADGAGVTGETRGNEYFASAEIGYRFQTGHGNLAFIPQAQVHTHITEFDSYQDSNGLQVSNLNSDRSTVRLGVSLEDTYQVSNGNLRLIGTLSWSDVFESNTAADMVATQVDLANADEFIEGNLGFEYETTDSSSVWASVNHKSGLGGLDSENTSFDLGFSVKF